MFDALEILTRKLANRVGLDIKRYRKMDFPSGRLDTSLRHQQISLVVDVGANTGQFASSLRSAGYKHRILSFEPLESAHRKLLDKSRADPLWEVAPRMALGDTQGQLKMNVSGNSVSSSAMSMNKLHEQVAPNSSYVSDEIVPLSRLDIQLPDRVTLSDNVFLKIDTQGYEDKVLGGAQGVIDMIRGVQVELSLVELYEAQVLYDRMIERIRQLGFELWSIAPGICDVRSGRMLQFDAVFFRD